jgi:hypothetical protein
MPKSHPCEGLPPAAVKAFNAIAAGMPPRSSGKTLALLLERGLIHRVARPTYFDDGLPRWSATSIRSLILTIFNGVIGRSMADCVHGGAADKRSAATPEANRSCLYEFAERKTSP